MFVGLTSSVLDVLHASDHHNRSASFEGVQTTETDSSRKSQRFVSYNKRFCEPMSHVCGTGLRGLIRKRQVNACY